MSHYKTIWSPKGVQYEIAPELANELVLNEGWYNTKPVLEEPEVVGDDEAPPPMPFRKGRKLKPVEPSEDEG